MNTHYMLDTNTVSYIIKDTFPAIQQKLLSISSAHICISTITEAALLLGLAKKPTASRLKNLVHEFLLQVEILPWDSAAAFSYAQLRHQLEQAGIVLGALDTLIAAHAISINATLVTNNQAFYRTNLLKLTDWSKP